MSNENQTEIQKKLSRLKVLVAEDMEFDREVLVSTLKKIGLRDIQIAENGSVAISKAETALAIGKPFDVILSDWKMPTRDGRSLLKFIRSHSRLQATIVIMTTGTSGLADVLDIVDDGVDDFIVKPISLDVLKKKILTAVQSRIKNAG